VAVRFTLVGVAFTLDDVAFALVGVSFNVDDVV
jgi:hypothetical protein